MNKAQSALSTPDIQPKDLCVFIDKEWDSLISYMVISVDDAVTIAPAKNIIDRSGYIRIELVNSGEIFVSPYSLCFRKRKPTITQSAIWIRDLASSHLRSNGRLELFDLIDLIGSDQRLNGRIDKEFISGCLMCSVASGVFDVNIDKRKKQPLVKLELSKRQAEVEKNRLFAGSLASELDALSERIRNLILHTSTVGTYRENLFQMLLNKHLPERYHVASGFIFGCSRQIDILIYDRIDYAPMFREGDLVVVPPESVRAVIEVKTNLTKQQLVSSLGQIEDISNFDDLNPPIFKGIFGFESDLEAKDLLKEVVNFYTNEPDDFPLNDDDYDFHPIMKPYWHMTALCVLNHVYGQTDFKLNENNRLIPTLYSLRSATDLASQVTYFLVCLLSYLRHDALKPFNPLGMAELLGADTYLESEGQLARESWGPYFSLDEGVATDAEDDVRNAESTINATKRWLLEGGWGRLATDFAENGNCSTETTT